MINLWDDIWQGRKKVPTRSAVLSSVDWENEREHGVRALIQLLNLNLHRLWEPPVVEEEFIKYV